MGPEHHAGRLAASVQLVLVVAFEAAAVVALTRLGSVERWEVDWAHLGDWAQAAPLEDAVAGLLRWTALVLATWLLASTLLYTLARLSRIPSLVRGTQWAALPAVRGLVDRSAAAAMVATSLVGAVSASPAWAHGAPVAAVAQAGPGAAHAAGPSTPAPPPVASQEPAERVPTADPSQPATWEVARGDNLWEISAAHLGAVSGRSGEEVSDAEVVPYWRSVCDANRATLRSGQPGLIYPGEQITLPPVMAPGDAAPVAPPVAATPPPPAGPPPTAEAETSPAPTASVQTTLSADVGVGVAPDLAPDHLPVPVPAPEVLGEKPMVDVGPRPEEDAVSPSSAAPAASEVPTPMSVAPAKEGAGRGLRANAPNLLGGGLLAAGVIATLDRLRRAQMRRRRPGQRIPLPSAGTARHEWAAREGADHQGAELFDLGVRAMARGLADAGTVPPEIVAFELDRGRLEVVLATPAPAPAGFVDDDVDGHRRWVLVADSAEELRWAEDVPHPLPAVVTLGRTPSGTQVLVDLVEPCLTTIVGDDEVARELVWAAAAEMANRIEDMLFALCLVGFGDGLASPDRRVEVLDSFDRALDYIENAGLVGAEALAADGFTSSLHAQVATAQPDSWGPLVVLCDRPPTAEQLDRLVIITSSAAVANVAVLVVGDAPGAARQLRIVDGLLEVPDLDQRVVPQRLSVEEAAAIGEMFEIGHHRPPSHLYPEPSVSSVLGPADLDATGPLEVVAPVEEAAEAVVDEVEEPPVVIGPTLRRPEVLVRVLGPVGVELAGQPVAFARMKAVEALAYLVTHRGLPIDGDRLGEALWPRSEGRLGGNLNTTLWEVRDRLGAAVRPFEETPADAGRKNVDYGARFLPPLRGARRLYEPGQPVGLDYDLVVEANRLAVAGDIATMAALRGALELVVGQPFESATSGKEEGFLWAHADGLKYEMAAGVVDAAHRLAKLCLQAGDLRGARWAAGRGMAASPGNEVLCRDRMRIAAAAGSPAGVDAVMDELRTWVGVDQPCDTDLDPETVALYRKLRPHPLGRRPRVGASR